MGVQILAYGVLALILALTVASAVAAFKVKDVDKARAVSDGFRQARMWVAVLFIFGTTVAPFKHGLTAKGVPGLLAWPMTVVCPLFLALFMLGLADAEKELGFGTTAITFVVGMTGVGFYMWVAGGWDLVDRFFGVP